MILKIKNSDIRNLWLRSTGLAQSPAGPLDILQIIKKLGFVQLDTIKNVTRAHHHILWSRNGNYQEHMLDVLLKSKNSIFEHFTHDASVIPLDYYPMWDKQFKKLKNGIENSKYFKTMPNVVERRRIVARIKNEGPLSTRAFNSKIVGEKVMWSRPPHKRVLDYLWYSGELATSHRENFHKFYDLSSRVIPKTLRDKKIPEGEQIDWLCKNALDRLNFATPKDVKDFWGVISLSEARAWFKRTSGQLIPIKWQAKDGSWVDGFAPQDIEDRLKLPSTPTTRLRIINPFDPAIRDRSRLKKIFGFDYKIEIFVPQEKRNWGYYVYPLLEGNRFVGRIELKANRKKGVLNIINLWPETGVKWGNPRHRKLDAELNRFARFANLDQINWL